MRKCRYYLLTIGAVIALWVNFSFYLNIAASQKYEVEHPRSMYGDDENLRVREADLQLQRQISLILFLVCTIVTGTGVFQLIRLGRKLPDHSDDATSA